MEKIEKKLKKGQSLTFVTLKSRSRSTISMPALPFALRNIYVKFDQIHQIAFEKMGGQKIQAKDTNTDTALTAAVDPETSQTHIWELINVSW